MLQSILVYGTDEAYILYPDGSACIVNREILNRYRLGHVIESPTCEWNSYGETQNIRTAAREWGTPVALYSGGKLLITDSHWYEALKLRVYREHKGDSNNA